MPRLRDSDARPLSDRAGPLIEEAAERSRVSWQTRVTRLRLAWRSVLQAGVAAGVAWLIATEVFGHDDPFFAPVSAIITLGLTISERGRRAVEVAIGVALGIAVGDLLVLGIGVGAAQLSLVVMLATALAIFLGSGQMFATQAAVSAALVATLQPPTDGVTFARFLDALAGGTVALVVNAVVLPADPVAMVRNALRPLAEELAATLEDVAQAILERDRGSAERALLRARGIDELSAQLVDAVDVSRETTRFAPPRRRLRSRVERYADAATHSDLAVRNVRVLARGTIRAVRLDENVPPEIAHAVRDLAAAVRAFPDAIDRPERVDRVRDSALSAAATATRVLEETGNLSVSVIVGQVRSTSTDLMAGTGLDADEAADAVRRAVGGAVES
ncbi:MAG TPA: FUSC family protein [Solirubrobacteraceae bacterium]|nr:FUSC family protein [Solirubrobacteraceae bacterium]